MTTGQQWPTRTGDGVSLNPDTFVEGGLPLNNVDGKISNAHYELFDYGGKSQGGPAVVLNLDISYTDPSTGEARVANQKYSVGRPDTWEIGPSTFTLKHISGSKIVNSSNCAALMTAFVNCGFPKQALDLGDSRVFNGVVAHWEQKEQKAREGLSNTRVDDRGQEQVRRQPLPTALRTVINPQFTRDAIAGNTRDAAPAAPPAPVRGRPAAPAPAPAAAQQAPAAAAPQPAAQAPAAAGVVDEDTLAGIFADFIRTNGAQVVQQLRIGTSGAMRAKGLDIKAVAAAYKTIDQIVAMSEGTVFQAVEKDGQKLVALLE